MRMIAQVNRELKKMGREERLVRGRGYYYFVGGKSNSWPSDSVYVYSAESLDLDRWMREFEFLRRGEK